MRKTGIYKILCNISKNFYIGSSSRCIIKRWNLHKTELKKQRHHSPALQNAYNKYGVQNFEFIVLEECDPDKCIEREQYYIDTLKPEYNCNPIAGSRLGAKLTEEHRRKIGESQKGKKKPACGIRSKEQLLILAEKMRIIGSSFSCAVFCENTRLIYKSIKEAKDEIFKNDGISLDYSTISAVANLKRKHTKGYIFRKVCIL